MDAATEIKRRLSMEEVARQYGFDPNRGGYIACPFHGERTPSLKVYAAPGRGYHCYGCGAGGSVVDFVMRLFGLSFAAAIVRLNADFHLGLTSDRPDPRELARYRRERAEADRAARELEERRMALILQHRALWHDFIHGAPGSPEYAYACKHLDSIAYRLEELG